MKNTLTKIFVAASLLIIFIPLILFALRIKIEPTNKNERKISLNFKRNFPLKKDLIETNAYIKNNVFNVNPIKDKAVQGTDGWKFLGDNFSNALSESKGIIVFTKEELIQLKNSLSAKNEFLNKQGIDLYISVASNKHSVYGDFLPIRKTNRNTKREQLDSICKTLGIKFINLSDGLQNEKKHITYHKTDTHWNDLGAFYGFKNTLNTISKDYKDTTFNIFDLGKDITIEENIDLGIGDLNQMLLQDKDELSIKLNISNPEEVTTEEKRLKVPENYQNKDEIYEARYSCSINDLKILVLCDSFSDYYKQYIIQNFGSSLFVWNHKFDKTIISSEKPDILLYEIVERDVDLLLLD